MSYTYTDYLKEEKEALDKQYPKIKYKKQVTAKKQQFCEDCGCEIHIGEEMFWYKPRPEYNKRTKKKTYFKWRPRCIDCEPMSYEELKEIKAKEAL